MWHVIFLERESLNVRESQKSLMAECRGSLRVLENIFLLGVQVEKKLYLDDSCVLCEICFAYIRSKLHFQQWCS